MTLFAMALMKVSATLSNLRQRALDPRSLRFDTPERGWGRSPVRPAPQGVGSRLRWSGFARVGVTGRSPGNRASGRDLTEVPSQQSKGSGAASATPLHASGSNRGPRTSPPVPPLTRVPYVINVSPPTQRSTPCSQQHPPALSRYRPISPYVHSSATLLTKTQSTDMLRDGV